MFRRTDCEGFHRRDFLQVGSAGLLGLVCRILLRPRRRPPAADKPKAKSVILVWLAGGPATIDMWDNKPDAPEGIRGEFKSIDTHGPGVQFAESLPKMAERRRQGDASCGRCTTRSRRTARRRCS